MIGIIAAARRRSGGGGGGGTDPSTMFGGGQKGGYYDGSYLAGLWKDTAGTIPVTADGDLVARWDDRSGNGNHLIQATGGARPVYRTSGGLHWLEFDGSDDYMRSAAFASVIASPLTVCAAWMYTGAGNKVLIDGNTLGNRGAHIFRADPGAETRIYAGSSVVSAGVGPPSTASVDTAKMSGATSTYRRNGAAGTGVGGNPGTASLDGITLGAWQGLTNPGFHQGKVWQLFVREGVLTSPEQAGLETWIGAKAGLTI